jgi:hypothetical protein
MILSGSIKCEHSSHFSPILKAKIDDSCIFSHSHAKRPRTRANKRAQIQSKPASRRRFLKNLQSDEKLGAY